MMADSGSYDDLTQARRYAMAQALLQNGQGPVRSWTQGLANMANSALGGFQLNQLDSERAGERTSRATDNYKMFGVAPPGSPDAGADRFSPAAAPVPAASPPAAPAADTTGKIYRADEPSPLDPPSGADRDMAIRTIVAEAGNQPFAGQTGVAATIRNRAVDGSYGGDTVPGVITKPNAYEPWNTPAGRDKMAAIPASDPRYATAGKALDAAYFGNDPTDGATHFVAPKAQAALGRPMPSWAQGDGTPIGDHVFYSPDDNTPAARITQALMRRPGGASTDISAQSRAPADQPGPVAAGGNLFAGMPYETRRQLAEMANSRSPEVRAQAHAIAANYISTSLSPKPVQSLGEGYISRNGKIERAYVPDEKPPASVAEYNFYTKNFQPTPQQPQPMPYDVWSTAKARAGATSISNSVDMNSGLTYDKQLAEGLGKSHASLANGVEDAQSRARDLAAMQGAVDAIQKNGGTTGGLGQEKILDLKKTINTGMNALGITTPFNENDISDKEFLTKFNRQIAGAQAKNAVGARVTNFEMSNYLKANPGLEMSITGNQRLIGIQSQIEQRNIAVGNAIREATASAISQGKKIDPVTVQKIITEYDQANHVTDPVTGQDLTQSYALPEFNKPAMGTNSALAVGHETNIGGIKIKRVQ